MLTLDNGKRLNNFVSFRDMGKRTILINHKIGSREDEKEEDRLHIKKLMKFMMESG
jgi:hypothetical protein